MNTPQSTDGAQPEGSTIKRLPPDTSLGAARSDFHVPTKTPSPPSDLEETKEKPTDPKGPSPNTRLLTNLRSFNIDRSKYKHYGHQSLMTAQTLEEIIKDTKSKVQKKELTSPTSPTSSPPSPSTDLHTVKPTETHSHRNLIDDSIASILGIPASSGAPVKWPYNTETLHEIVKLKIEQEKTKQVTVKQEFGSTIIELLKLAKSMNINGDLIPLLFVDNVSDDIESYTHHHHHQSNLNNKSNIEELKVKIQQLQENPENLDLLIGKNLHDSQTPRSSVKRKYSEGSQLPSFDETAEKLKIPSQPQTSTSNSRSGAVSPLRSPEKLPHIATHRRIVSDNSDTLRETKLTSSPSLQSLKWTNQLQKHLPNLSESHSVHSHTSQPPQPHLYPVYYTPLPPKGTIGQPPPPGSGPEQSESHTASSTVLGSPYSQKYQPILYTPLSQFQPGTSGAAYISQQQPPQYHYYVPSPPSNQPPPQQQPPQQPSQQLPQQHPQYLVASGSQPIPMGMVPGYPPGQQIQYQVSDMERGAVKYQPAKVEEAPPVHAPKKHKSTSSKPSGINFMITTPKNPPAKKYNNTNKDKST